MNPQRAYHLGLRADDVSIRCSRKYGGEWVAFAHGRPVFQSASVFEVCRWVSVLGRCG